MASDGTALTAGFMLFFPKLAKRAKSIMTYRTSSPDDLRAMGGMVSAHNDFEMDGKRMTFWLMSFPAIDIPGAWLSFQAEGQDDADALDKIRLKYNASLKLWQMGEGDKHND